MERPKWLNPIVILMVILIGAVPLFWYTWVFANIPTLTAGTSLEKLNQLGQDAVLVDVRSPEEYAEMHVEGSYHWPLEQILVLRSPFDLPAELTGKTLILLCSSGIRSAQAARRLASIGINNIYHVSGGIQMWIRAGAENPGLRFSNLEYGQQIGIIYHPMPVLQQIAVIVSGFGFKPLHMLLSLVLGWVLLRQKANDLRTLGWGVLIFFAAEAACAVNYLVFDHTSYLAEYLHSFGMVVAFGFSIFAIQQILDDRLIKLSAPTKRCAFVDLCKDCIKSGYGKCKARNLFLLGTGLLIALAFLPLVAQPIDSSYNTSIFSTSYHYCRVLLYQYFESRYLPIVVLLLCIAVFMVMMVKKNEPAPALARLFLAGALAAWVFSFFRLTLSLVFRDALIWGDFWEEATELMFVVSFVAVIWIYKREFLREPLFKDRPRLGAANP